MDSCFDDIDVKLLLCHFEIACSRLMLVDGSGDGFQIRLMPPRGGSCLHLKSASASTIFTSDGATGVLLVTNEIFALLGF